MTHTYLGFCNIFVFSQSEYKLISGSYLRQYLLVFEKVGISYIYDVFKILFRTVCYFGSMVRHQYFTNILLLVRYSSLFDPIIILVLAAVALKIRILHFHYLTGFYTWT